MFIFETFSGGAELRWSSCCESLCQLSGILQRINDFKPHTFKLIPCTVHPDWSLISTTTSGALLCLSTRGRLWTAFVYTQLMKFFELRAVLLTLCATNNLAITFEHWTICRCLTYSFMCLNVRLFERETSPMSPEYFLFFLFSSVQHLLDKVVANGWFCYSITRASLLSAWMTLRWCFCRCGLWLSDPAVIDSISRRKAPMTSGISRKQKMKRDGKKSSNKNLL